tara:strand:- start:1447 stop:1881 length:435 start_codon:yes stop_codon:yes gene_type:complete
LINRCEAVETIPKNGVFSISIKIANINQSFFISFEVLNMTYENRAQAQQEGERLPNEKRYCVWKCPTHTTNQKPQGKNVKEGCNRIQIRITNPAIRSQATCKKCGKKPRLDEGNYLEQFPYDLRGKYNAKAYVEACRTDSGWER